MDENTRDQACPLQSALRISDPSVAEQISGMMLEFTTNLERSANHVHAICPPEESKAYKKAAAGIYIEIFLNVLEPLYKQHPSLKPPDWD